jgi:hypothetical protein
VALRFWQYAVQRREDRAFAPLDKNRDWRCRRRASKIQGYYVAALAALIVVIGLARGSVAFANRAVIAAVRTNRTGMTMQIGCATRAKSTKDDIHHKRERGDENARSSPAVPISFHLFGFYNPLCERIFPDRLVNGHQAIIAPFNQRSSRFMVCC